MYGIDELVNAMLVLSGYYAPPLVQSNEEYSCVMAMLNDRIAQRIIDWGRYRIPDVELYTSPGFGRVYDIHATVKYGLHTNNPLNVMRFVQDNAISPFDIVIGEISLFENDELYDVVKLEVKSEPLEKLNGLISSSLQATDTQNEYIPHITIAYVKRGMGAAYIGMDEFSGLSVNIDRLTFSDKNGRSTVIPLYGVVL